MNLRKLHRTRGSNRKQVRGFTIVELLIVIVVIAILAATTVVAFNGVQTRANNTKTLAAVGQYVKALQLFATNNGRYPINTTYPCLGDLNAVCGATQYPSCFGYSSVTGQQAFIDDIRTVLGSMPELSTQQMDCNGAGGVARGGFYYSVNGISVTVQYFLRGDVACQPPAGLGIYQRNQAVDATDCRGTMAAP